MHNLLKVIERKVRGLFHFESQKAFFGEKPNALFSSEHGNLIRCSVFRNSNPSNLRGSLLEGNKDHLFNFRQDQTWRSKNIMSGPSISASVNYNDKRKSKDWRFRTHNTDLLNLDETSSTARRIIYLRKVLRITQMGEIKRAQEQRIDEVSVPKLRENRETIQQLTSQLQQMEDQTNSMNDSRAFQDVESNYCGRLSRVSSQLSHRQTDKIKAHFQYTVQRKLKLLLSMQVYASTVFPLSLSGIL